MNLISLHFSVDNMPQLLRSEFHWATRQVQQIAVRGKSSGAYGPTTGSFQWTPAVQALSAALLVAATRAVEGTVSTTPLLEGGYGSPASSLAYALAKQPRWLLDMFGCDRNGTVLSNRFFRCSNQDRKRNAPTAVGLAPNVLSDFTFTVYQGEQLVRCPVLLHDLSSKVLNQWTPQRRAKRTRENKANPRIQSNLGSSKTNESFPQLIRRIYREEIHLSLCKTDIFQRTENERMIRGIHSSRYFSRIAGNKAKLHHEIDHDLYSSERLGLAEDDSEIRSALCGDTPIVCAVPPASAGAFALFTYLQEVKGYNITLSTHYPHAVEIARRILNHDFQELPDLCVLGVAPAAHILRGGRKSGYSALMRLPQISHAMVVPRRKSKIRSRHKEFFLMKEEPSGPEFYFDRMVEAGVVSGNTANTVHCEPDEMFPKLANADDSIRAIFYFPHYQINKTLNNCDCYSYDTGREVANEFFLFANNSILSEKKKMRCLNIAIRDAWLTLRENPAALDRTMDNIVSSDSYMSFLRRATGVAHVM